MDEDARRGLPVSARGEFTTTHSSVVLAAGCDSTASAQEALEQLCRVYWYPLYAFLRWQGHGVEQAQDLVQGFFLHLMRGNILRVAEPGRGRFRSFLLGTLKHFISDERGKATAQKRGGDQQFVSWDLAHAERFFGQEPADPSSPDRLFERRWAMTLLEQAFARLQAECMADDRSDGPHRGRSGRGRGRTALHAGGVQSGRVNSSAAQLSGAVCPVKNGDAQREI